MGISFSRSTRRWVAVQAKNGHFGRSPLLSFLAWDVLQSAYILTLVVTHILHFHAHVMC